MSTIFLSDLLFKYLIMSTVDEEIKTSTKARGYVRSRATRLMNEISVRYNDLNYSDRNKYLEKLNLIKTEIECMNKNLFTQFTDDDDIRRERQRLCIRGNMLIRAYNFCSLEVKYFLFKTYMYSFYCSSLWSTFNVESLRQLKVVYNMVMRKLAGYPRWHSATDMFSRLNMRSFPEQIRNSSYSFMVRLDAVPNFNMYILGCSDARIISLIHSRWNSILYVH